jgi:hypothetical protein
MRLKSVCSRQACEPMPELLEQRFLIAPLARPAGGAIGFVICCLCSDSTVLE